MKKVVLSFLGFVLIGMTFAFSNGADVKLEENLINETDGFGKKCCTRTARNGDETATVRACKTHEDNAVAYGKACEAAIKGARAALAILEEEGL